MIIGEGETMRIAMISDAHGNLHGLDAVLADLDGTGPYDEVIYGGDFAFRGAFPAEVIDRIRERGYRAVRGNTDEFLVEMARNGNYPLSITDERQRHTPALQVFDRWALDRMTTEQVDYLADLPLRIDIAGPDNARLTIAHATPWSAHVTVLPDAPEDVARQMLTEPQSACTAYGHIHHAYRRSVGDGLLTSVGSVGAPMDGDWRAAYVVLTNDGQGWDVEFRRVEYDIDAAQASLRASTLPDRDVIAAALRTAAR
ncbi:MAG TPA: metallophosphoesterase family protein [Nitrolancea sp.]|nr:metallophosphoesterase family protein [Nitrolancea sp.]